MAKGKVWRDGKLAIRHDSPKKGVGAPAPGKSFKRIKNRLIEDDLENDLKVFLGKKTTKQSTTGEITW
jgi:hypothetical protein